MLIDWMQQSTVTQDQCSQELMKFRGDVEFKHVSFAYPTRPDVNILKDFSLKIAAGSHIAVVGPSG